jgi:hypothetical protein
MKRILFLAFSLFTFLFKSYAQDPQIANVILFPLTNNEEYKLYISLADNNKWTIIEDEIYVHKAENKVFIDMCVQKGAETHSKVARLYDFNRDLPIDKSTKIDVYVKLYEVHNGTCNYTNATKDQQVFDFYWNQFQPLCNPNYINDTAIETASTTLKTSSASGNEFIYISNNALGQIQSVSLYNSTGIINETVNAELEKVDYSKLSEGTYLLKFDLNDGKSTTFKVNLTSFKNLVH